MNIIGFIKAHISLATASVVAGVSIVVIAIVIVMQSSSDEELNILIAGEDSIPIIKQEDLDELGKTYSILNEQFEREINAITTGQANRHNKMDKILTHYGVYGRENIDPFKNDEYTNGIRISYQKTTSSIADRKSNFNDIIAVMSVLYDQEMDQKSIDELKETFTNLFWLSHTFTYDSDELYPCRYGCLAENNYLCTAAYNDYKNTQYLKYELFTVPYHEKYRDLGYTDRDDFKIIAPSGKCSVCNSNLASGRGGAGCIWESSRVCYHGSGQVSIGSCNKSEVCNDGEAIVYSEVGEEHISEYINEQYLVDNPSIGSKMPMTDTSCQCYQIVRYCKTREKLAKKIKSAKDAYKKALEAQDKHSNQRNHSKNGSCCDRVAERVDRAESKVSSLESELDAHVAICELGEIKSQYWCDGYKLCLGHRDHYKCDGRHKVVLCSGHTNINVNVRVMYGKELLDYAFQNIK